MDNRVWVKDAVMTIRLPEEVDHFVADRLVLNQKRPSHTHNMHAKGENSAVPP